MWRAQFEQQQQHLINIAKHMLLQHEQALVVELHQLFQQMEDELWRKIHKMHSEKLQPKVTWPRRWLWWWFVGWLCVRAEFRVPSGAVAPDVREHCQH